jgi:oligoribonuclease NrnB/cAMP/cGMP phosphodiesterase (DHH superfamily)
MTKKVCIYDYNCPDGFGAAWVVKSAHPSENIEFVPGIRNTILPDVTGKDVIMVDFAYNRAVIAGMAKIANSVLIIDHHITAINDLMGIEEEFPNIKCVFDISHSGCVLTWQYYYPGIMVPTLLQYIEDTDLWKHALPNSRAVMAVVYSYAYTFEDWEHLMQYSPESLVAEGTAIDRKHKKDVLELIEYGRKFITFVGHDIPILNVPYTMVNDVGSIMGQGYPFAMMWMEYPAGIKVSLRSAEDGVDVSVIAQRFGGGGHKHAAAYTLPAHVDILEFHGLPEIKSWWKEYFHKYG